MANHQSPLAVLVKGALAGAAGAGVMGAFRERAPEPLRSIGMAGPEPAASPDGGAAPSPRSEDGTPGGSPNGMPAEAVPFAHGVGWGAYFAVIQSTLRPWPPLHGVFLGGLMTLVGARLAPQLGMTPRPGTRDELAVTAAAHVVFGVVTALVYQILNFGRRG